MSVAANSPVSSSNVNNAFMSRTAATTSTVAAVTISNTTQSTNKDTGALIVDGGVGVEKNLNVGGDAAVTGALTSATLVTSGNGTVGGNLTVTGDLTVNGTTTTLNTATVESEDNNILLNKGGNDASAEGGGIDVTRTSDNGAFRFDSALTSKWKLGLVSAMSEVIVAALNQTITGVKTFTNAITMQEVSTPSTPASGFVKIYPKSDGKFYSLDDAGTETELGSGGPTITGTRASPQTITAAGGLAFTGSAFSNHWWVKGSVGGSIVSASPQIAAATSAGQRLKVTGTSDTDFVQFADGTGLITGGMTLKLGNNSVVVFEADHNLVWVLESTNGLLI